MFENGFDEYNKIRKVFSAQNRIKIKLFKQNNLFDLSIQTNKYKIISYCPKQFYNSYIGS